MAWSLRGDEGNTEGIDLSWDLIEGSVFILRVPVCITWPWVDILRVEAAHCAPVVPSASAERLRFEGRCWEDGGDRVVLPAHFIGLDVFPKGHKWVSSVQVHGCCRG